MSHTFIYTYNSQQKYNMNTTIQVQTFICICCDFAKTIRLSFTIIKGEQNRKQSTNVRIVFASKDFPTLLTFTTTTNIIERRRKKSNKDTLCTQTESAHKHTHTKFHLMTVGFCCSHFSYSQILPRGNLDISIYKYQCRCHAPYMVL